MGHKESLHVQALAGDAAGEMAHLDSDRGQRKLSTGCHGRDTQVRFQRKAPSSKTSLFASMSVPMFDIQA